MATAIVKGVFWVFVSEHIFRCHSHGLRDPRTGVTATMVTSPQGWSGPLEHSRFFAKLASVTQAQLGHLTNRDVKRAGFGRTPINHYLNTGKLTRIARGVFRVTDYPKTDCERVMAAWLWSRSRGTFNGWTALRLYGLPIPKNLENPLHDRVQMILPEPTQSRFIPEWLEIGDETIEVDDVGLETPWRVVSAARAFVECLWSEPEGAWLGAALKQGSVRGLWTQSKLHQIVEQLPNDAQTRPLVARLGIPGDEKVVPSNIEPEHDLYFGRVEDEKAIAKALEEPAVVVTLRGPPGVGKTRLARHFALAHRHQFEGGVWFCDLSQARGADDICDVVAAVLNLNLAECDELSSTAIRLERALLERTSSMVVLDNFEHLVRFADETVGHWATSSAPTRWMVTSREPLGLAGEAVLPVRSMSLPLAETTVEDVLKTDAVRLFSDRVRAVRPDYQVEPEIADVILLLNKLDGLPLAIELAAARMALLTAAQVRQRIVDDLKHLSMGSGESIPRHATMHLAINWSWELLEPSQRGVFEQCSVFAGGFTLASAEAVLVVDRASEASSVEAVLMGLVERSLIVVDHRNTTDTTRFRMFGCIRQFAEKKLGARPAIVAELRDRHAWHYTSEGEHWLRTGRVERLNESRDNLMAVARQTVVDQAQAELVVRSVLVLDPLLDRRGPWRVRIDLLKRAAALCEEHELRGDLNAQVLLTYCNALPGRQPPRRRLEIVEHAQSFAEGIEDNFLLAAALARRANLLAQLGKTDEAKDLMERASLLLGDDPVPQTRAILASTEARICFQKGLLEQARASYERATQLFGQVDDRRNRGTMLGNLAITERNLGHLHQARRHLRQAIVVLRDAGFRMNEGIQLANLGNLHAESGELGKANGCFLQAMEIHQSMGNRQSVAHGSRQLGDICLYRRQLDDAQIHYDRALALFHQLGDPKSEALVRGDLAIVMMLRGNWERARTQLQSALDSGELAERPRGVSVLMGRLAVAWARLGDFDRADEKIAQAEERLDRERHPYEHHIVSVYGALVMILKQRSGPDDVVSNKTEIENRIQNANAVSFPDSDHPWGPPTPAQLSSELRLALALFQDALSDNEWHLLSTPCLFLDGSALIVVSKGERFRAPGGSERGLELRTALHGVFSRLVAQRLKAPGQPVNTRELVEAGWPDERVVKGAGSNRVYVAINTLRSYGLKKVLITHDDGYLLDPSVTVFSVL